MTLWPLFAEEARLRSLANLKQFSDQVPGPGRRGQTRDIVAGFLGISGRTMERLKYEHEEHPEIV